MDRKLTVIYRVTALSLDTPRHQLDRATEELVMGLWANLVADYRARNGDDLAGGSEHWNSLFGEIGSGAGIPLGSARWMAPDAAVEKFAYTDTQLSGRVWIGEALDSASPSATSTIVTFVS